MLGTFTSTFVYCLLVLRSVQADAFIPHVSVSVAIALALASVGVLIYFIHHVSVAIHADSVIAVAGRDLDEALASEPERAADPPEPEDRGDLLARHERAMARLARVDEPAQPLAPGP